MWKKHKGKWELLITQYKHRVQERWKSSAILIPFTEKRKQREEESASLPLFFG